MQRLWKVQERQTGRVLRTYSTDRHAIEGYLSMFIKDPDAFDHRAGVRAADLDLVSPRGDQYPVEGLVSTWRAGGWR